MSSSGKRDRKRKFCEVNLHPELFFNVPLGMNYVKLTDHNQSTYELFNLFMKKMKKQSEFWCNIGTIIKSLHEIHLLVDVDEKRQCKFLAWCMVTPNSGTGKIEFFETFVRKKGYARILLSQVADSSECELYVHPNKHCMINGSENFWAHVLPCWQEMKTQLCGTSSARSFFSTGTISIDEIDDAQIFTWQDNTNEYLDSIIDATDLPFEVLDLIMDYDRSMESAINRLQKSMMQKFDSVVTYDGIEPALNYTELTATTTFNLIAISPLLFELPKLFWSAPTWTSSYQMNQVVKNDQIKYCSNGEFILSALLLGYAAKTPKKSFRKLDFKMDKFPKHLFQELV